ncbi:MAG: DUF4118 domain-containing protein [Acidimicrobiia bacterium]|nr:DUF4118 domain-containing protein [Acidimicrobiia bacterium]
MARIGRPQGPPEEEPHGERERPGHPLFVGYTLALVTCGVAGLVQYALSPVLGDRFPLAVFSAAVAVAAWTGGSGPGLFATLCAAIAGMYFFVEPRYTLFIQRPDDYLALTFFILTGTVISLSMRRLRRQALSDRDSRAEAERLLAEAEKSRGRADLELRERQKAEERLRESEAKYRGLAARTNKLYELSVGLSEAVTVDAVARVMVHPGEDRRGRVGSFRVDPERGEHDVRNALCRWVPPFGRRGVATISGQRRPSVRCGGAASPADPRLIVRRAPATVSGVGRAGRRRGLYVSRRAALAHRERSHGRAALPLHGTRALRSGIFSAAAVGGATLRTSARARASLRVRSGGTERGRGGQPRKG